MSGYLEQYGVEDARRLRILKRIALVGIILLIAGTSLYFVMRNYREKGQVNEFLAHLRAGNYEAAYQMWGCPCPGYQFERFLEDWGPESPYGPPQSLRVEEASSCGSGTIVTLQGTGREEEVHLWVERDGSYTLGFSPWPVCNPVIRVPGQP
jgi:hypothetical protein